MLCILIAVFDEWIRINILSHIIKAERINMHYWENRIFRCKERSKQTLQKTTFSSCFSQSSISHNESHERKQTVLPHRHLFLPFRLIDAGNGGWQTRSRMPRGHNPHNIVCRDWRWCNRLHRLRQDLPDTGWHHQD